MVSIRTFWVDVSRLCWIIQQNLRTIAQTIPKKYHRFHKKISLEEDSLTFHDDKFQIWPSMKKKRQKRVKFYSKVSYEYLYKIKLIDFIVH